MISTLLKDVPLRGKDGTRGDNKDSDVKIPLPENSTSDERNPEKIAPNNVTLPPGVVESDVAGDNKRFYQECQDQQWPKQIEFIINLSYIFAGAQGTWGSQWLTVGAGNAIKGTQMRGVAKNMHVTANIIRPLTSHNTGRMVGEAPDASVVGLTMSKRDMAAAEQADAITAHVDQIGDPYKLMQRATLFMQAGGHAVWYGRWNNKAWGDIATELGPDGSVEASSSEQVGEIEEDVISILDFYPDYKATKLKDCGYVMRAYLRPVAWVKDQTGITVEGGPDGCTFISFDQLASLTTGDYNFKRTWSKDQCLVLDRWVKPTGHYEGSKYPNGLRVMTVRDKVIKYTELPKKFATSNQWHPFAMSYWEEAPDSIWGSNPVSVARPLQDSFNQITTNYVQRLATAKPMVLTGDLSGVKPGKTTDPTLYDTITFDGGMDINTQLKWWLPPPVGSDTYEGLNQLKQQVQDIMGSHELSPGATSASMANISGEAIEKLQVQDSTKLGMPYKSLLRLMQTRSEVILMLYAEYCAGLMRLLAIDQQDNPGVATQLFDYQAFMSGSYRVISQPSNYNLRHPAAKQEVLERYYTMGAFGPVGTPAAIATFIELQQSITSSNLLSKILTRVVAQIANTPNPAQMQQEQQQQQLQGEQALLQMKLAGELQQSQQEAEIKAQAMVKQAYIEQMSTQQQEQYKYTLQEQARQAELAGEMQRLQLQSQNDLLQSTMPKVSISIATPTPEMIAGAGVEAGLIPPSALGQATTAAKTAMAQDAATKKIAATKPVPKPAGKGA